MLFMRRSILAVGAIAETLPAQAPATGPVAPFTAAQAEKGKAIYAQRCASWRDQDGLPAPGRREELDSGVV
jgi:hypothetical protein